MRKENPPFRQCFEHVFDFTIFAGVCFMKALPSVSTIVISFGYGGVHAERTRGSHPHAIVQSVLHLRVLIRNNLKGRGHLLVKSVSYLRVFWRNKLKGRATWVEDCQWRTPPHQLPPITIAQK